VIATLILRAFLLFLPALCRSHVVADHAAAYGTKNRVMTRVMACNTPYGAP
jgi:hypothetical protein